VSITDDTPRTYRQHLCVPCPACGSRTASKHMYAVKGDRLAVRRKRHCVACKHRFDTVETVPEEFTGASVCLHERKHAADRYMALHAGARAEVRQLISMLEARQRTPKADPPLQPDYTKGVAHASAV
jgi:phage terminase large subunit GpA-like protein